MSKEIDITHTPGSNHEKGERAGGAVSETGAPAPWLWSLVVLVATAIPYLLAWRLTPEGMRFTGALLNPDDMGVYVSAMRQGASGHWLYQFTYSSEPWQPRLMLLPYLLLGKITALLGEPDVFWLHIWRLALAALTLGTVHHWLRALFAGRPRLQRSAWLLTLLGNGLGWLAVLVLPPGTNLAPDIGLAEWTPLLALFNTPHFALGLGLEILAFTCLVRLEQTGRWRWAAATAGAASLAGLTYVYHLAVLALALALFLVFRLIQTRRAGRRAWTGLAQPALVLAALSPLLGYYAFGGQGDPYWLDYTRVVHVIPPPPPLGLLIGLGGLLPLAVAGVRGWLRGGGSAVVPVWTVANLAALYAPGIDYSGRFALGLTVPFAALAAAGLENHLLPAFRSRRARRSTPQAAEAATATLRRICVILLAPSTLMSFLLFFKGPLTQPGFPFYLPEADVQAAVWLGDHAGQDALTLAYYPMGNYLPRVYPGRVFLGQAHFTTDLEEKLALFETFWSGEWSGERRAAFLADWGITHVYAGTFERPFQQVADVPGAVLVYDADGVAIYALSAAGP